MCGRYDYHNTPAELEARFGVQQFLPGVQEHDARYNVAPTDSMPVVRREGDQLVAEVMRWGLIPYWSKDAKSGARMINARCETVAEKPGFRDALRRGRRCLVPANGFYEWVRLSAKEKQPMYVHRKDDQLLAFAGLWEEWRGPDGPVRTYTVITTEANSLMAPIHDRMPVVLDEAAERAWLDPERSVEELRELLRPAEPEALEAFPVNRAMGSVAFQGPACLTRAEQRAFNV